jgi:hypothetical protein
MSTVKILDAKGSARGKVTARSNILLHDGPIIVEKSSNGLSPSFMAPK